MNDNTFSASYSFSRNEEVLKMRHKYQNVEISSFQADMMIQCSALVFGLMLAESIIFKRQMATLYNPKNYDGKDRVLEMCYTDLGETYQIFMGASESRVFTDGSLTYTTRIETPYEVWVSIARNEIRGDEALMKQMYKVTGDFSIMINWNRYFGSDAEKMQEINRI